MRNKERLRDNIIIRKLYSMLASHENNDSMRGPLFTLDGKTSLRLFIEGQENILKKSNVTFLGRYWRRCAHPRRSSNTSTPSHMLHTLSPNDDASRVPLTRGPRPCDVIVEGAPMCVLRSHADT